MTSPNVMRRAVLSDPYPLWLEAVEHVLRGLSIEVVGRTTSVHEALELLDRHEPDMFVTEIDTRHAEIDAISFLIRARERLPDLKIIVFSSYDDMYHIESALAAGATAYVIKTTLPQDFASAIRQLSEHSVYLATSLNGAVPLSGGPHRSGFRARGDKKLNTLTRRELEILRLVADGSSNAALAKTLCVSEQTVKFHLSNIYRKLGVSNRTEASRWAHVRGLLSPYSASSGILPEPARVGGQAAEAAPSGLAPFVLTPSG